MNIYDYTEVAYKNGYEDGKRDAIKHGKWVWKQVNEDTYHCHCSSCGALCRGHYDVDDEDEYYFDRTDFCPDCGADMREDDKHEN